MKKFTLSTIVLICLILCVFCTKADEPDTNQNCDIIVRDEKDVTDSIFFQNNKVYLIKTYSKLESQYYLHSWHRLEYLNDSEMKLYYTSRQLGGPFVENFKASYIFDNSKISQVEDVNGVIICKYVYEDTKIKYVLYYPYNPEKKDSIVLKYDTKVKNISEATSYVIDASTKKYRSNGSRNYVYDDKKNPFYNSTYGLIRYWNSFDNLCIYFNTNNILSYIGHNYSYVYNDNNYPKYFDNLSYNGLRTHYTYQCK